MSRTADPESLLRYLITSLVDAPDSVSIAKKVTSNSTVYEISVEPDDVGKVIGRQGRIIKAIRTVIRAASSVNGDHVDVEVLG